jgi:2-methylisocitrate lyase-like PEP mutase family enzyme
MAPNVKQLDALAAKFKAMHISGQPVKLANAWDAATARIIASVPGTTAIATASWAVGNTAGFVNEDEMRLEDNVFGIHRVIAGVRNAGKLDSIPISADVQDGYADTAVTIRKLIELGIVGCNIEDMDHSEMPSKLRPAEEAAARIRLAMEAARDAGVPNFVINARSDVLGHGGSIDDAIARGKLFLEAGASTIFIWGVMKIKLSEDDVKRLVSGLDGKVAVQARDLTVKQLQQCGVARISIGPHLLRLALAHIEKEAKAMYDGDWMM